MLNSGKGGQIFYVEPFGRTIKMMNTKPVNYSQGGYVKWEEGQFHPFLNSLTHDNKPVLLEYESMVVPKPVIHLFHEFEEIYGSVKIPQIKDKNKLTQVIIMPGEAIIPKIHVPKMKAFLAKNGVTLPLEHTKYF